MAKKFKNPPKINVSIKVGVPTDLRKERLKKAKGIKTRLEKAGYDLGDLDLEKISTRALKNLDRKKMIRDYATQESIDKVIAEERALKERKKILRAQKKKLDAIRKKEQAKVVSIDEAKKQDDNWKPGDTYQTIPAGSEAKIQVDLIIKQIEEGENRKGKRSSSDRLIHESAGRLRVIFEEARRKYSDEEIVQKIEKTFGSMEKCSAVVERLIYAVYDEILNKWADGVSSYDHLIGTIVGALGVTDPGGF